MSGLGLVAQLVEQRTFNPLVASSSLAQPTKNSQKPRTICGAFVFQTVSTLAAGFESPDNLRIMKPSAALDAHRREIREIVLAHHASNARVFGSVAKGLDQEGSDIDILIDPTPETTLFDIGAIRFELKRLLGVAVDVVTPNGIPDQFRSKVIAEALTI